MDRVLAKDTGGCKASIIIESVAGHDDRFDGGTSQPMIIEDTAEFKVGPKVPGFKVWDLPGYNDD
tara:strand:+ start:516 stop:710 length:195 start_codon:yes stop_codon:yes gene_type:complete